MNNFIYLILHSTVVMRLNAKYYNVITDYFSFSRDEHLYYYKRDLPNQSYSHPFLYTTIHEYYEQCDYGFHFLE